jgi:polyketide biosynthesis enoyl-CoA hydratase PksH
MDRLKYETIEVRVHESVRFIRLFRSGNRCTITTRFIEEFRDALAACKDSASVVVLESASDAFCLGADFHSVQEKQPLASSALEDNPSQLYDIWTQLATGPYVSIAHVRGKANAGGIGFVAACDMVLADQSATFGLSELLFGLLPACVLPFLIRRIGFQRAHYLTLLTLPISAREAHIWGLVDAFDENSDSLLRRHLLRLRNLPKRSIARYKSYTLELDNIIVCMKDRAIARNVEVFSDPENIEGIKRYVEKGLLPWQTEA